MLVSGTTVMEDEHAHEVVLRLAQVREPLLRECVPETCRDWFVVVEVTSDTLAVLNHVL